MSDGLGDPNSVRVALEHSEALRERLCESVALVDGSDDTVASVGVPEGVLAVVVVELTEDDGDGESESVELAEPEREFDGDSDVLVVTATLNVVLDDTDMLCDGESEFVADADGEGEPLDETLSAAVGDSDAAGVGVSSGVPSIVTCADCEALSLATELADDDGRPVVGAALSEEVSETLPDTAADGDAVSAPVPEPLTDAQPMRTETPMRLQSSTRTPSQLPSGTQAVTALRLHSLPTTHSASPTR